MKSSIVSLLCPGVHSMDTKRNDSCDHCLSHTLSLFVKEFGINRWQLADVGDEGGCALVTASREVWSHLCGTNWSVSSSANRFITFGNDLKLYQIDVFSRENHKHFGNYCDRSSDQFWLLRPFPGGGLASENSSVSVIATNPDVQFVKVMQ